MIVVRIVLGSLIALLVVVVAVPALALMDLVVGGSGLGLCENGLRTCDTSLFTLLELLLVFSILGLVLSFGIAGCLRVLSRDSRVQPR